jgi:hypothetical protein
MDSEPQISSRPTVNEIYAELVKIRRTGLNETSVRKHGDQLVTLPIVADELRRGGHATTDKVNAAIKAVECAVDNLTPRDPEHSYLLYTLIRIKSQQVSERILDAREAMGFSVIRDGRANDHIYSQLETDLAKAYRQLAAALVRADSTPCTGEDVATKVDDVLRRSERALISNADAISAFRTLSPKMEARARSAVYEVAIRLWPKGAQLLADSGIDEELQGPSLLAAGVIRTFFSQDFHQLNSRLTLEYLLARILSPITTEQRDAILYSSGTSVPKDKYLDRVFEQLEKTLTGAELEAEFDKFLEEMMIGATRQEAVRWPIFREQSKRREEWEKKRKV